MDMDQMEMYLKKYIKAVLLAVLAVFIGASFMIMSSPVYAEDETQGYIPTGWTLDKLDYGGDIGDSIFVYVNSVSSRHNVIYNYGKESDIEMSNMALYSLDDFRYMNRDGVHTVKAGEMLCSDAHTFGMFWTIQPYLVSFAPEGSGTTETHYVIRTLDTGFHNDAGLPITCTAPDLYLTVRTTVDNGDVTIDVIDEDFDGENAVGNIVHKSQNDFYRIGIVQRGSSDRNSIIELGMADSTDKSRLLDGAEIEISSEYGGCTIKRIYRTQGKPIFVDIEPFINKLKENESTTLQIKSRPLSGYTDYTSSSGGGKYFNHAEMTVKRIGNGLQTEMSAEPVIVDGKPVKNNSIILNSETGLAEKVMFVKQKIKKAQPLKVTARKPSVRYSRTRKRTIKIKKAVKFVKTAKGKVTYKKTGGSKKLTISKKTGTITVKKGTKKGTYKIRIKISASGDSKYKAGFRTVTVKVKVK